jgi:hypothetical protein
MPVDASIYSAFIRPVRSLAEYEREAADVDGARSRNALQALSLRQGLRGEEDAARTRTEQEGARNALAGLGGGATPDARINALRGLGTQTGFAQADALEKGHLERQKTEAEVGSKRATTATSEFDLRKKRLDFTIGGMVNAGDVEGIKQHLVAGVQRGDIDIDTARQMMQNVPADPAAFGDWRRDTLMRALDAKEQMRFTTPDAGQRLSAQTSVATNAASNARQAADAAAGRAVTMRGQNMTDARARDLNATTKQVAAETKKAAADEKAVTKFAGDLQKEGIPEIESALRGAESVFAKYTKPDGKLGDVPGLGRVANALPDWAILSREGTDVRESLASVANIVLAARSGAAVTDQELRRLARELSLSVGKTPEDTRRAYDKFRKRFDFVKQNLAAGASDTVKAEYEARGGIPIPRGGAKPAPAAAGGFKYLGTE